MRGLARLSANFLPAGDRERRRLASGAVTGAATYGLEAAREFKEFINNGAGPKLNIALDENIKLLQTAVERRRRLIESFAVLIIAVQLLLYLDQDGVVNFSVPLPISPWLAAVLLIGMFFVLAGITGAILRPWIRQYRSNAEVALENCRVELCNDLGQEKADQVQRALFGIGQAMMIAQDAKISFQEEDLRKSITTRIVVVGSAFLSLALSGLLQFVVRSGGLSVNDWLAQASVPVAIALPFVLVRFRPHFLIQLLGESQASWIGAIAKALHEYRARAIIAPGTKSTTKVETELDSEN